MKTKVYLDTSVISALFDERTPERLAMTSHFWSKLEDYEVFISELVLEELERANEQVKDKMFSVIKDFRELLKTPNSALRSIYKMLIYFK